jgi:hypothetical protein
MRYQEGQQLIKSLVRARKGTENTKLVCIVIIGNRKESNKIETVDRMRRCVTRRERAIRQRRWIE